MFVNNRNGLALPLVLLAMLTASLLGIATWQYSVTDTMHVALDADRMQAHYLARSGADALAEFLVRNPSRATEMIAKTATNKATGTLGNDKNFQVNVTGDPKSLITITSEGKSGEATESLMLDLTPLTAKEIFNNAIFSKANLDVTAMKSVTGDLESAGNIFAPSDYRYRVVRNSERVFSSPLIPSLPIDPSGINISVNNNETRTITGNFAYDTIAMAPNATLVFDNRGGVQQVAVRSLTTKGNISVVGAGRLELYITGSADFQTPLVVNHNNPNNLFVFLADNTTLAIQANGQINAFIYGPNANVQIQSGNSIVNGAIIANLIVKNDIGYASNSSVNFRQIDHGIRPLTAIVSFRRSVWRKGR